MVGRQRRCSNVSAIKEYLDQNNENPKPLAFIEQGGVDRGGRAILEAFGIQHSANGLDLVAAQCAGRSGPSRGRRRMVIRQGRSEQGPLSIERSASDAEGVTGGFSCRFQS
jgi:hypothetical protein